MPLISSTFAPSNSQHWLAIIFMFSRFRTLTLYSVTIILTVSNLLKYQSSPHVLFLSFSIHSCVYEASVHWDLSTIGDSISTLYIDVKYPHILERSLKEQTLQNF